MDALKFMKERRRMCDYYGGMDDVCNNGCNTCPRVYKGCELSTYRDYDYIKEYIADVEKWSKEYPQRTRLQDFLGKYPNAPMCESGLPSACCMSLGYCKHCDDVEGDCEACWNMPVEEEDE